MTPNTALLIPVVILVAVTALVAVGLHQPRLKGRHEPGKHVAREFADLVVDPLTERELALARLDYGAESLAVNARMWEETTDDVAARMWNANFDWALANLNERFDALVAGLPTTAEDPFPTGYWPVVSAPPVSVSAPPFLDRLARFSPDATIEIIMEHCDTPTVFSWTTQEYAMVGAPAGSVQVAQQGSATFVRTRTKPRSRHRARRT